MLRNPLYDPRTVAREIPGIFDSIFPQLTPGVVAYFNRSAESTHDDVVPLELVERSSLQRAMLFELGFAVGEGLISGKSIDWDFCIKVAISRQRQHFDAKIPARISDVDKLVAEKVGRNMQSMLSQLSNDRKLSINRAPVVPGYQWISSGYGDFSLGSSLIEVKCSSKNFSSSDYRQIVMYWLLSFAASVERNSDEWVEGILLNPRSAKYVTFKFDEFLHVIGTGRTKVDILQLFSATVDTRNPK